MNYVGLHVRIRREIRTGDGRVYPAGTVFEVRSSTGGRLHLDGGPTGNTTGQLRHYIRGVARHDVVIDSSPVNAARLAKVDRKGVAMRERRRAQRRALDRLKAAAVVLHRGIGSPDRVLRVLRQAAHDYGAARTSSIEAFMPPVEGLDLDAGQCPAREDGTHCVHWWDGDAPCCSCKHDGPETRPAGEG